MKALTNSKFTFPFLLLIISLFSYGIMSPWMKYFHDEYSIFWFHTQAKDITLFFEGNRPHLAYIYLPLLKIFGTNSYLWSLFSIFTRWFHSLCVYWLIRELWDSEKQLAIISALLCIVYPAFQAQFASMLFGIIFFIYSLFILSLLLTARAIKSGKNKFLILSLSILLSFINLATTEYFFVLELLRYAIIWQCLPENKTRRAFFNFIRVSFPYLILFKVSFLPKILMISVIQTFFNPHIYCIYMIII